MDQGDSGIGKMAEVQATVAFRDIAAYFLEKEWACLEEGKKELYKRAMENIHLVIISLGHTIANPDVLIKIKADSDVYDGDPQSPGMECLDQYSTSSQTTNAPDILLRVSTDEVPQICKQESSNEDAQTVTIPKSSLANSAPILWNNENLEASVEIDVLIPCAPTEKPSHVLMWSNDIKVPQMRQGIIPQVKGEPGGPLKSLCAVTNMRKIAPKAVSEPSTVNIANTAVWALAKKRRIIPKAKSDVRAVVKMQRIAPKGGSVPCSEPGTIVLETANVVPFSEPSTITVETANVVPLSEPSTITVETANVASFSEPSAITVETANVVPFSEPSTITLEMANVEPSTIMVETTNVGMQLIEGTLVSPSELSFEVPSEPSISTVETANVASTPSALQVSSRVFGVVYSMFNMNHTHRGQMRHVITADEIARRFAEPERFSLRFAQRYLRQQKRGVAVLAEKCQQHNLQPNATAGVTSAWTLITEGDVKYLLESTQTLAAEHWPAKEIARHLNHISQTSSSRALQLEHSRNYLENLHSSLDEKLVNFDMITHGGAILLVKLVIDCIKSTIEEEMVLQPAE